MTSRQCFKCGLEKPVDEFYPHRQMGGGRLRKCKECTRRDVRENYAARREYYRAYDRQRATRPDRVNARREYALTEAGKRAHSTALSRQIEKHPEKYRARIAVGNALRDGRLQRKPCEVCGSVAQAHHEDYSKPLDVTWLCVKHHRQRHRELAQAKAA